MTKEEILEAIQEEVDNDMVANSREEDFSDFELDLPEGEHFVHMSEEVSEGYIPMLAFFIFKEAEE